MIESKTIAAISTPLGKGGVALIRISGSDSLEVAKRVFRTKSSNIEPRKSCYGEILRDGKVIDDGILTYFKGPSSFTGEDVCEICCHGGIYVTKCVLEVVLSQGAIPASAGEFTKRAYINGRLTLSRAEAIGNIIDAKTDAQLTLSSSQARGTLSKRVEEIREKMLNLIAHVYATIDYPDEDIDEADTKEMLNTLTEIVKNLEGLKKSYRAGKAVCEGVKTAIVGKPNAGKSSLYNMLLGENVAIVTDIEGTTRDIIESTASLGGVTINLADTAGIRDTEDVVEKIGVERARNRLADSELVLCVFDYSKKETAEDLSILKLVEGKSAIAIINKIDTPRGISLDFEEKIKNSVARVIYTSTLEGRGYEELSLAVEEMFDLGEIDLGNDAIISNARQSASVSVALEEAKLSYESLAIGQTPDIVCASLEKSLEALDMIDARGVSEEIVSAIFSKFCVGK